jgi:hypothetical protein
LKREPVAPEGRSEIVDRDHHQGGLLDLSQVEWARAEGAIPVTVSCRNCGLRARATVQAVGVGKATSFLGIFARARPRFLASTRAQAALDDSVSLACSVARCPGCGRRERAQIAVSVAIDAGMSLLLAGLTVLGLLVGRHPVAAALAGPGVVLLGVVGSTRKLARSARAVRFGERLPGGLPAAHVVRDGLGATPALQGAPGRREPAPPREVPSLLIEPPSADDKVD